MKPAVLILGATGKVGRGVVRAAVDAGWPVVAVARDGDALQKLSACHASASLQTVVGSVSDDASADLLVAALQKLGRPFAGVISALGSGDERGRLLDQSSDQLRQTLDDAVLPQLVAARHLLPWLAGSGRNCGYVLIGGPGGRHPWAGYGHRSVAAAAVRMLAQVLHSEARAFSVRLQLLEVESPVRTDDNQQHACKQWPGVDQIGRKALALLEHRNDARCTDAVIDYRSEACNRALRATVEKMPPRSSIGEEELTLEPLQAGESSTEKDGHGIPVQQTKPQEMDSDATLLPARCLQDVSKLLEMFTPTKKNQEQTR